MVTPGQDSPSDDEDLSVTPPPRNASTLPVTPTRYSSSAPMGSGSSIGGGVGVAVGGSVGDGADVSVGSGSGVTVGSGTEKEDPQILLCSLNWNTDRYGILPCPMSCHWLAYQELISRSTRRRHGRPPHSAPLHLAGGPACHSGSV